MPCATGKLDLLACLVLVNPNDNWNIYFSLGYVNRNSRLFTNFMIFVQKHGKYPALSKSVSIQYMQEKGRYAAASVQIKAGKYGSHAILPG